MPFRQLKHSVALSNNPLICEKKTKKNTDANIDTTLKTFGILNFFNFMENVRC